MGRPYHMVNIEMKSIIERGLSKNKNFRTENLDVIKCVCIDRPLHSYWDFYIYTFKSGL